MCLFPQVLFKVQFLPVPRKPNIGYKSDVGYPFQAFKSLRDKVQSLKNKMAQVLLFRLCFFTIHVSFLLILFIYTRVLFQGIWEVVFFYCTYFWYYAFTWLGNKQTKHAREAKFKKMWTRNITRNIM